MALPTESSSSSTGVASAAWALWETFLDLPHPHGSSGCPPPFVIRSNSGSNTSSELEDPKLLGQIVRFSFPEHDDRSPAPPKSNFGAGLNRFDVYVTPGFQHHSFSLQLQHGDRVYGHVRRYLPSHSKAGSRSDVGRRGVRAMVLLTKAQGGDTLYAGMLKTLEGLTTFQSSSPEFCPPKPQELFLRNCFEQHQRLCRVYLETPPNDRQPMVLVAENLEYSSHELRDFDTHRFLVPLSLLQKSLAPSNSPMLPLLRCLGIANSLRLISALLSERRVILISASPNRLTTCARAALSILAQGLLTWQHLFIPVLPPHLIQYLQAPFPYLIGILRGMCDVLNHLKELGEVLLINLDRNDLETRGIPTHLIASKIPDLFRGAIRDETLPYSGSHETSATEMLAQDLTELLKTDRRTIFGETTLGAAAETTVKAAKVATKAVKSAFGQLKKKGRQFLAIPDGPSSNSNNTSSTANNNDSSSTNTPHAVTDDEIYTEGCHNETGEDEARVAFCMFFLCLHGDMRWYLSHPTVQGQTPTLDRDKFLSQKRNLGDGEGTPIFPLLQNMCQTQMFEQFVKVRVEEVRSRFDVTRDSPLFLVCANYHRTNHIDYSPANVRRVTRQVAQANPSRLVSQANAKARDMAMKLTSNRNFDGDHGLAVANLVENCREASVMMDVMSVVWMRLRDCKGIHWKHGVLSLHIVRNMLFHGPVGAIAEVTDGLETIRQLRGYRDNIRGNICHQMQQAASQVYVLIVDRAKLFALRRTCAQKRRDIKVKANPKLVKDRHIILKLSFRSLHPYLHPQNSRQRPPDQILHQPASKQQYHQQQQPQHHHTVHQQSVPQPPRQTHHIQVTPQAPYRQQQGAPDLLGMGTNPSSEQPGIEVTLSALEVNDVFSPNDAKHSSSSQLVPSTDPYANPFLSPGAPAAFSPQPKKPPAQQQLQYAPTIVTVPPARPPQHQYQHQYAQQQQQVPARNLQQQYPQQRTSARNLQQQQQYVQPPPPTIAQIPPQQYPPHQGYHQQHAQYQYPQHPGYAHPQQQQQQQHQAHGYAAHPPPHHQQQPPSKPNISRFDPFS